MDYRWREEVDRIDQLLHAAGVPASVRMGVTAQFMDALAIADKERRTREQLASEAISRCHGNVRMAAKQEGWSHETFYRLLRPKKVTKPPVELTEPGAAFTPGKQS